MSHILLHKNEQGLWDLTLVGIKLEKATEIMRNVLDNAYNRMYQQELDGVKHERRENQKSNERVQEGRAA